MTLVGMKNMFKSREKGSSLRAVSFTGEIREECNGMDNNGMDNNGMDNSDSNNIDSNNIDNELDKIFHEKLFISKNDSNLQGNDNSNLLGNIQIDSINDNIQIDNINDNPLNNGNILGNDNIQVDVNSNLLDFLPKDLPNKTGILKDRTNRILNKPSLKGIYQGIDEEITETRKKILTNKEMPLENNKIVNNYDIKEIEEDIKGNKPLSQIEEEFLRMKKTQLETLKLKSKIYKFIYNELIKIDQKYSEKVKKLESENHELKETIDDIKNKYEKYKVNMNENMMKYLTKYKAKVIVAMKEYKKKCDQKK